MFFVRRDPTPVFLRPSVQVSAQEAKEKKGGDYRDKLESRLSVMQGEGWIVVFTDGSAKQVGGWWQAGFGVYLGRHHNAITPPPCRHMSDRVSVGQS